MSQQKGIAPDGSAVKVELPEVGRPGCGNCAFAVVVVDHDMKPQGFECRRYAPQPGRLAVWPVVQPHEWCGMYTSRAEFADSERARREAMGALALLRDTFDPSKTPPENLNG